jgi:hypothetical protein
VQVKQLLFQHSPANQNREQKTANKIIGKVFHGVPHPELRKLLVGI